MMLEIVQRIDWRLLREQKQWLLNQGDTPEAQGLVELLDAFQDAVVADHYAREDVVYDTEMPPGVPHGTP